MRLEEDSSHGLALRAGASIGDGFEVSRWSGIHWRLAPQLGAATAGLVGDAGNRGERELFAGVRASFLRTFESEISADGISRGAGGHLGIRISRSDAGPGGWLALGYDSGL